MRPQPNLYTVVLLFISTYMHAQQLKLGNNPGSIQKSALLELDSKSQGLLLPRISDTTQATLKSSPDGMIIFLTLNNSLCIRTNGAWQRLLPEGNTITSINGQTVATQLLKTTNVTGTYAITSAGGSHTLNIPNATATANGFMSTTAQTFAGSKVFTGAIIANGSFILNNGMTSTTGAVNVITSANQPIQLISADIASLYGTSVTIGSESGTTITQDLYLPHIAVNDAKDTVLLIDQGKVWKKRLGAIAQTLPIRVITDPTTVTDDDYTIVRNGTNGGVFNITLPAATGRTGKIFIIKLAKGASDVLVNASGSSFDGDDTNSGFSLTNGESVTVQSDGTYWYIISTSSSL